MSESERIEPCPWCGSRELTVEPVHPYLTKMMNAPGAMVYCLTCQARGPAVYPDGVERWNALARKLRLCREVLEDRDVLTPAWLQKRDAALEALERKP